MKEYNTFPVPPSRFCFVEVNLRRKSLDNNCNLQAPVLCSYSDKQDYGI